MSYLALDTIKLLCSDNKDGGKNGTKQELKLKSHTVFKKGKTMITFCFWGILFVAALSSVISLIRDIRYIGRWISSFYFPPIHKAITINIKLAPKTPSIKPRPRFFTWFETPEDSSEEKNNFIKEAIDEERNDKHLISKRLFL